MNTLLNDERDQYADSEIDDRQSRRGSDREITLGTMTILGIFFALAVLCAAFFGFGYTTGRKAAPTSYTPATVISGNSNGLKPSAGNNIGPDTTLPPPPATATIIPVTPEQQPAPLPAPKPAPVTRASNIDPADTILAGDPLPAANVPANTPAPLPAIVPTGQFMVQVAAVSHPEDADLLVTTLRRVHYAVAIHTEPQDKLLHVQVGPFATRKDAEAMRQRLLTDGFNAIVK